MGGTEANVEARSSARLHADLEDETTFGGTFVQEEVGMLES